MTKIVEITQFIYSGRSEVENQFDSKFRDRFGESIEEAARLFDMIEAALYNNVEHEISDGTLNAGLILWKCLKSILAGLQIWRCGYWGEASILLRSPLESAAVALLLHQEPKEIDNFRTGNKSIYGKALAAAYKIVPPIKTTRQLLSEIYVHPSEFDGVLEWKGERFSIVGEFSELNMHRYRTTLFVLESVLKNVGMIIEYVFFDFASPPLFWEKGKEGQLERLPLSSTHLERFFEDAELVKQNTGIDIFDGQEAAKELLLKVLVNKKKREKAASS